jgi:CDP-diacylglycerol--serine O-phosphatidyltransferase
MASFVWTCADLGIDGMRMRHAAIAVTVIAALLMVSRIRYNSFKGARGPKGERVPFFTIVVAVAVLIALVLDPPKVLLAAASIYALSGPVGWLRRRRSPPPVVE